MSKRIRISQMVYNLDVQKGGGGITRFVIQLCHAMDPSRYEVSLISLGSTNSGEEKAWVEELASAGIQTVILSTWQEQKPYQSFWNSTQNLLRFLQQNPQDILHSHSEFTDISGTIAKLTKRVSIVCRTIHYGYHMEWRKRPLRRLFLTNFLYPLLINVEIGINHSITKRLNSRWVARILDKEAITIFNAINLNPFSMRNENQDELRKSFRLPDNAPIIGSIGRLTEQKGYCYLLDSMPYILTKNPAVYCLIIGDGELREELQEQAKALDITRNVIFTGPRADIPDLLALMDLFVSPSLWEGLPTVILESMASNTPVIATEIPGTRDLIDNYKTGRLVPPKDPQALAEAVLQALDSPASLAGWSQNAQEVVRRFSIESIARKYDDIYLKIS